MRPATTMDPPAILASAMVRDGSSWITSRQFPIAGADRLSEQSCPGGDFVVGEDVKRIAPRGDDFEVGVQALHDRDEGGVTGGYRSL
jgi:hypothetical protein